MSKRIEALAPFRRGVLELQGGCRPRSPKADDALRNAQGDRQTGGQPADRVVIKG